MTKSRTDVTHAVALAALLGGAGACAESESPTPSATGEDPVEASIANLGTKVTGCAAADNGFSGGTLTLTMSQNEPVVLSAGGGVFAANGIKCTQTLSGAAKDLKTNDVQKINIVGTTMDDKVILDFLPGSFGTKVLAAAGGISIDFAAGSGAGNDSVMLRAGSSSDTYHFASVGSPATAAYIEITNDKNADIEIKLGTGTTSLTASMGGGNDTVIGNSVAADMDKFSGTPISVAGLTSALNLTAYGGAGDDKFTGGDGNDAFYGGAGKDTFKMGDLADGADIYQGDDDIDTVDYHNRVGNLHVDIGTDNPSVEGLADLRAPGLYGASGALAGKVLALVIDGARTEITFGTPANPAAVLTAINDGINGGPTGPAYATLTGKNHLLISSSTKVLATSFVKVEDDPGVAATAGNAPYTTVGVAVGSYSHAASPSTLPVTGNADLTGITFANLMGKTLYLVVDGVFVKVPFTTTPADAAAVVATIDTAIATALNTTGVKYATLDPATNFLKLDATKTIDVKLGTAAYGLAGGAASAATALGFRSSYEVAAVGTTYGATGDLASTTVALVIDGARVEKAYGAGAGPANAAAFIADINGVADTALGTTGVKYASLSAAGNVVISSNTDVANLSAVRAVGNSAIAAATADAAATLGIGGRGSIIVGNVDISPAALYGATGTLKAGTMSLLLAINGEYVAVDLTTTAATDASDLVSKINTAVSGVAALSGIPTVASLTDSGKHLRLSANWIQVMNAAAGATYTSAQTALNLRPAQGARRDSYDADDGLVGEFDDVRYSTENITSGSGDDVLIGSALKNTIKGGAGNDLISGGAMASAASTGDADALQGEAGNDTFVQPMFDARAVLTGGDGDNVADFSGRSLTVELKNNGTADDGEPTTELANIASDIKTMIGGFGADKLTGGSGDDTLIGGPGADELTGGAGNDTVSYASSPAGVTVDLCFGGTSNMSCPSSSDGYGASAEKVYQVEHLIGSPYVDNLSSTTATASIDLTIEGGASGDMITGGPGSDTIFGDAGDDVLAGGAGDDQLQGDAGDDSLDGGGGDADICLTDSSDDPVVHPKLNCEL